MTTDAPDCSGSPNRFRVWVSGRLDERFIDDTEDLELGESPSGSTLEGPFVDHSQLRGLLDRLWDLGIKILGFETYAADPMGSSAED